MNEEQYKTPTVWASLGATINMGNFNNQKIDVGVAGIPVGASKEYIDEQMNLATQTLTEIVNRLAAEMNKRMAELGR